MHGAVDDVVRPRGEVHVADGAAGEDQSGNDLGQVVRCNTVTKAGVEECAEGRDDSAHYQCDNVGPDGESDVLLDDNDETEHETDDKDDEVPPLWRVLVVLGHVRVVRIIKLSFFSIFERSNCVAAPEEHDVGDESTDRGIGHEHGVGESTSDPRQTVLQ